MELSSFIGQRGKTEIWRVQGSSANQELLRDLINLFLRNFIRENLVLEKNPTSLHNWFGPYHLGMQDLIIDSIAR